MESGLSTASIIHASDPGILQFSQAITPDVVIETTVSTVALNLAQILIKSGQIDMYALSLTQSFPNATIPYELAVGNTTVSANAKFQLTPPTSAQLGFVFADLTVTVPAGAQRFAAMVAHWSLPSSIVAPLGLTMSLIAEPPRGFLASDMFGRIPPPDSGPAANINLQVQTSDGRPPSSQGLLTAPLQTCTIELDAPPALVSSVTPLAFRRSVSPLIEIKGTIHGRDRDCVVLQLLLRGTPCYSGTLTRDVPSIDIPDNPFMSGANSTVASNVSMALEPPDGDRCGALRFKAEIATGEGDGWKSFDDRVAYWPLNPVYAGTNG